jgi:hypothetical protein
MLDGTIELLKQLRSGMPHGHSNLVAIFGEVANDILTQKTCPTEYRYSILGCSCNHMTTGL